MVIKVNEKINNGFSSEDADKIKSAICEAIRDQGTVTIDFAGVKYFTTLFFSQALTYLISNLGEETYAKAVNVINLSESGEETYRHAVDYAKTYYSQSPEERQNIDRAIENSREDI